MLQWQPHNTVTAIPLASSHRLMPSNHTMFWHKAARCSLSHAAPRALASPLPLPSPAWRSWKAQAPRWLCVCRHPTHTCLRAKVLRHSDSRAPCPHRVIPLGVIQAALPGDACRAPGRSCGKATALAWRRLHPAVPASARGAHGHPHSILATIPQVQALTMHCVALPSAGNLLCRHRHPPPPKEGLEIH